MRIYVDLAEGCRVDVADIMPETLAVYIEALVPLVPDYVIPHEVDVHPAECVWFCLRDGSAEGEELIRTTMRHPAKHGLYLEAAPHPATPDFESPNVGDYLVLSRAGQVAVVRGEDWRLFATDVVGRA